MNELAIIFDKIGIDTLDVLKAAEAQHEYGIELTPWEKLPQADALVAAVAHCYYQEMPLPDLLAKAKLNSVFVDVKSAYDPATLAKQGCHVWRL